MGDVQVYCFCCAWWKDLKKEKFNLQNGLLSLYFYYYYLLK